MVHGRVQSEKAGIEGIIDVGVVVIAHFENPARLHAFDFLKDVLLWKKNQKAPIIYSIDGKLARRAKEVEVINPIPAELFSEYNRWLNERLGKYYP
jgi:hypothetical protein